MTSREWRPCIGRLAAHGLMVWLLLTPQAFARWQLREFPILYASGWPAERVVDRLTVEGLRRIAAAHYNTVMCETPEIELVAKAGLRCLVIGRSHGAPDYVGAAVSPAIAHTMAGNPAVWGYFVTDEPENKNSIFQRLAANIKEYRAADPTHVAWINVSPALGGYLHDYMEIVQPDLLSYDDYRWWAQESDWWRGLEAHRDAARGARVPMIMWVESNSSQKRFNAHLPPAEDNATKIRWSVYSSLAYGCKGIQWFTGSTAPDVAHVNAELTVLGPTLVGLESTHVFHTSAVPREGRRLPESSWYFTDAQDLLIGEFVDPDEPNASYFLIVNKSIVRDNDVVFEIRRRVVSAVEEINRTSAGRTALPLDRQAGTTRVRLHLPAGDGHLIRVASR
jgi:hypothetical protein